MLDALKLDNVDQKDDDSENSETDGQCYAGILRHVHAFVRVNT